MDSNSLYCNIYKGKIKESIYKVTKLVIEDTNGKNIVNLGPWAPPW